MFTKHNSEQKEYGECHCGTLQKTLLSQHLDHGDTEETQGDSPLHSENQADTRKYTEKRTSQTAASH